MSQDVVEIILAANVADAGTFTVSYPQDRSAGSYELARGHEIFSSSHGQMIDGEHVSFSFGASEITVTNNSGTILPQGSVLQVGLDLPGGGTEDALAGTPRMAEQKTISINLGSPIASDADGISASQGVAIDESFVLDGALASAGTVDLDTPRNVVAAWTGAAVITVTGEDEYGAIMVESSASGTSFAGKKAFKRITSISTDTAITSATAGTGKVLGLPVVLTDNGRILSQLQDGVTATAGTVAVADTDVATATTGDVRGTYTPSANPNGSRALTLIAAMDNLGDTGVTQFMG